MVRHYLVAAGILLAQFPAAASAQSGLNDASKGLRVEGLLGYDKASFDSIRNGDGILYGIGVGYDLAVGRLRLGLEAEASGSTAENCEQGLVTGTSLCSEMGRDLYAGLRVGSFVSPNLLLYAKGGYTNIQETNRFTLVPGEAPIVARPGFHGFRLGAGAEMAVGARTYVKAEYRFSNYDQAHSFDRHQGVIGFGFRF
jgi:outer membrane immunogenic protein